MPKFDRYLLSQLLLLFGFFSLILVSIYWVNRAVVLFEQLINDGQSALVFLEFTALTLPNVVRLVLPVSTFAATVYVVNRLTTESELIVVQSMGFSSFRLARPVLFFGLIIALLASILSHFLVPVSRGELTERGIEISKNATAKLLREGQFLHPGQGVTLYIREISPQGELQEIFLSQQQRNGDRTTFTAKKALLLNAETGPTLILFDGISQVLKPDNRLDVTKFSEFVYDISGFFQTATERVPDIRELSTVELFSPSAERMAQLGKPASDFYFEAHSRIAQPFLPMICALVGFATLLLGGFSRFGIWRQIFGAVVLLIIIQLLDNAMADIAQNDPSKVLLVYLPLVAGLVTTFFFLWISDHPGSLRRLIRFGGAS